MAAEVNLPATKDQSIIHDRAIIKDFLSPPSDRSLSTLNPHENSFIRLITSNHELRRSSHKKTILEEAI